MSINSNESGDLPNYGTTPNIGDDEATPLLGNVSNIIYQACYIALSP